MPRRLLLRTTLTTPIIDAALLMMPILNAGEMLPPMLTTALTLIPAVGMLGLGLTPGMASTLPRRALLQQAHLKRLSMLRWAPAEVEPR